MTVFNALRMPYDMLRPLEFVDFDTEKVSSWGHLVGITDGAVGFITYRTHGVLMMHDDNGLLRDDWVGKDNVRAQIFEALLHNEQMRIDRILVGDFVLVGVDASGETASLPRTIVDLANQAHQKAIAFNRRAQEFRAENGL